jgi:hypothetical protein
MAAIASAESNSIAKSDYCTPTAVDADWLLESITSINTAVVSAGAVKTPA